MPVPLDLVLTRTLKAPRDLVWKAWTDPALLKQWFAPRPYEITELDLDLRPAKARTFFIEDTAVDDDKITLIRPQYKPVAEIPNATLTAEHYRGMLLEHN